jgi:hypothetical protein
MTWQSIIKTVAPSLATALGGPLAGAAVGVLSKAILGGEGSESDIEHAVMQGLSPDALAALKKADQEFSLEMHRISSETEKAYLLDVQDARKAHGDSPEIYKMAYVILGTFGAIVTFVLIGCYLLVSNQIAPNPENMAIIATISGIAGAIIGYSANNAQQVVGYFFGSSASSSQKTDAMADAIKKIGS